MTVAKIILAATLIFTLIFFVFVVYYGGLKTIKIEVREEGGETVVYESILGDYRKTGLTMDQVYNYLLKEKKIETFRGFGIYYDNPKQTPKSQLRSEAGCIVEKPDTGSLAGLPCDMKVKTLPVRKYMVTEFPYLGKLSVIFSLMKVYPALEKYAYKHDFAQDGAVTEIYDIPARKNYFRKELMK